MKPAQQKQQLGEIEVRQWFEDVDDERGILVREREVSRRYMDLDIEALLIDHVLHVLEGVELRILRAELRREIAAVGEESEDRMAALERLKIWVGGPFDWSDDCINMPGALLYESYSLPYPACTFKSSELFRDTARSGGSGGKSATGRARTDRCRPSSKTTWTRGNGLEPKSPMVSKVGKVVRTTRRKSEYEKFLRFKHSDMTDYVR